MLTKATMQEIQNLKLQGLTQAEIADYYVKHGKKPPSQPTIAKYYAMDVIPENPGEKLSKDKAFDKEPFRTAILRILENNENTDCRMSSVYDVLEEIFIENGTYESLPGNEQTLRNYIHYLQDSGQINRDPEQKRIYKHVFDTPPGDQMLMLFDDLIDVSEIPLQVSKLLPYNLSNHLSAFLPRLGKAVVLFPRNLSVCPRFPAFSHSMLMQDIDDFFCLLARFVQQRGICWKPDVLRHASRIQYQRSFIYGFFLLFIGLSR